MPWSELKRLEACCEVSLRSYLDNQKRLRWRMTVQPHDTDKPAIHADSAEIQDAVRDGMAQAIKAELIPA